MTQTVKREVAFKGHTVNLHNCIFQDIRREKKANISIMEIKLSQAINRRCTRQVLAHAGFSRRHKNTLLNMTAPFFLFLSNHMRELKAFQISARSRTDTCHPLSYGDS